jgi:hypothetical protein
VKVPHLDLATTMHSSFIAMVSKDPKKLAKKTVGKVHVKPPAKKGAKATLTKPHKAPAPKTKPES